MFPRPAASVTSQLVSSPCQSTTARPLQSAREDLFFMPSSVPLRFATTRFERRPTAQPPKKGEAHGGGERDRTDDLLLAKQALSQLSYTPVQITVIGHQ